MRIDQQAVGLDVMPGDVDVAGAVERQGVQEGKGIEAEIGAIDVDVVRRDAAGSRLRRRRPR
jgi:hypothetical protein